MYVAASVVFVLLVTAIVARAINASRASRRPDERRRAPRTGTWMTEAYALLLWILLGIAAALLAVWFFTHL